MGVSKDTAGLSRAERKSKKRQLEDAIPDLPGDDQGGDEAIAGEEAEGKSKKRKRNGDEGDVDEEARKAAKKEKKRRKSEAAAAAAAEGGDGEEGGVEIPAAAKKTKKSKSSKEDEVVEAVEEVQGEVGDEAPRKSKKERKAERKAKEAAEAEAKPKEEEAVAGADEDGKPAKKNNRNREKKRKAAAEGGEKEARFICFIGMFLCFYVSISPPPTIRTVSPEGTPGICFFSPEGSWVRKRDVLLTHDGGLQEIYHFQQRRNPYSSTLRRSSPSPSDTSRKRRIRRNQRALRFWSLRAMII